MRVNKDKAFELIEGQFSIDSLFLRHRTKTHVAILMKRGKILEMATNSVGSRSRGSGYQERTIHAERAVLKKVGDLSKLDGAILIVVRIKEGTKQIVNSEPCHSCKCHLEKCIKNYGLKTVYYST